jgi:hypothetical protein
VDFLFENVQVMNYLIKRKESTALLLLHFVFGLGKNASAARLVPTNKFA